MWIMTSFGILMPAAIADEQYTDGGRWDLQVRSRERPALQHLKRIMPRGFTSAVMATPTLDYDFRLYTRKEFFADIIDELIMGIDYEKFKPTTLEFPGGDKLHKLYNSIWKLYIDAFGVDNRYMSRKTGKR